MKEHLPEWHLLEDRVHVAVCSPCRERQRALANEGELLRQALKPIEAPPFLTRDIKAASVRRPHRVRALWPAVAAAVAVAALWFVAPKKSMVYRIEGTGDIPRVYRGAAPLPQAVISEACAIEFGDGSRATLGEQSQISFEKPAPQERFVVRLERGVARFQVEPGKEIFTVVTSSGRVLVVGTEFLVQILDDATAVTVSTGKVRLVSGGRSLLLESNQTGLLRLNQPPTCVTSARQETAKSPMHRPAPSTPAQQKMASVVEKDLSADENALLEATGLTLEEWKPIREKVELLAMEIIMKHAEGFFEGQQPSGPIVERAENEVIGELDALLRSELGADRYQKFWDVKCRAYAEAVEAEASALAKRMGVALDLHEGQQAILRSLLVADARPFRGWNPLHMGTRYFQWSDWTVQSIRSQLTESQRLKFDKVRDEFTGGQK